MMRRIELLPAVHLQERRQRRTTALIVMGGLVALGLLIGYWMVLGVSVANEEERLAQVTATNEALQADINELQRFGEMDTELKERQAALATAMTGDVDWPGVLTEVAMVVPGEIWFTTLTASAGQTEGAAPVATETAPVRVSRQEPFGRIQFTGSSLTMTGVADWLVRLGTVEEFDAQWLNTATEGELSEGVDVVTFDTTLELSRRSASHRYEEAIP